MEVYRELTIDIGNLQATEVIQQLTDNLNAQWSHNAELEQELNGLGGSTQYCFTWKGTQALPAASLWIAIRTAKTWSTSNIVPTEIGRLTTAQYNSILVRFTEDIVKPTAENGNLTYDLSSDSTDIEALLPEHVASALQAFSQLANKSTGSSHPCDFERWCTFLIACHRSQVDLPAPTLRRLLAEELGWSERLSSDLACEYEFASDLLKHYDR